MKNAGRLPSLEFKYKYIGNLNVKRGKNTLYHRIPT